jgi:uncharacterized protein YceK
VGRVSCVQSECGVEKCSSIFASKEFQKSVEVEMKKLLGFLAVAVLVSGCATIFTGTGAIVKVTAEPAAAIIVIKSQTGQVFYQGEVPASVKLPKKNN